MTDKPETLILSNEQANALAMACKDKPIPASLARIPPSLLSADHIHQFVVTTGLISPFYVHGKKPRLTNACYEGRIGKTAYLFDRYQMIFADLRNNNLLIPANSIAFVEIDVNLRLPNYVAVRISLQDMHAHRGLLLGARPPVDPGFWGKLYIPLYNVTSENCEVSKDDGLIWIEFIKTNTDHSTSFTCFEAATRITKSRDIENFTRLPADENGEKLYASIQSSIDDAFDDIQNTAERMERAAIEAAERSKQHRSYFARFVFIGAAGLAAALLGLFYWTWEIKNELAAQERLYGEEARAELRRISEAVERQSVENSELIDYLNILLAEEIEGKLANKNVVEIEEGFPKLQKYLERRENSLFGIDGLLPTASEGQ